MKHRNGITVDLDDIMVYLDHALTALRVKRERGGCRVVDNSKYSEVRSAEDKRFIELLSVASPETVTLVSHVLNGTMSPKDALFFAEVLKLQRKREILET